MRQLLTTVAGAALTLWVAAAAAQENGDAEPAQQLVDGCVQGEDIILRIESCTRLISVEREADGNPAWAFNNRGAAYESMGRLERALSDYNTALLLDPGFAPGYNNRGNVQARRGDLDAAIADHAKAVEIDPDYVDAWINLARDHEEAGEPEQAIEAYTGALEAEPELAEALANRSALHCTVGNVEASIADRLRLLDIGFFTAEQLQEFLQNRDYYDGPIDGIFGAGSRAALTAWTEAGCPR